MGDKNFTVVYVFGPKDKYVNYINNEICEWVKIGETSINHDLNSLTMDDIKRSALNRCKQESKTGIPCICKIYDTFIFPYRIKTDCALRHILCDDMYILENSKANNKNIDEDDIPAGTEFVYNVSRNNIKHAVESYDHSLIISSDIDLSTIKQICKINAIIEDNVKIESNTTLLDNFSSTLPTPSEFCINAYNSLKVSNICKENPNFYFRTWANQSFFLSLGNVRRRHIEYVKKQLIFHEDNANTSAFIEMCNNLENNEDISLVNYNVKNKNLIKIIYNKEINDITYAVNDFYNIIKNECIKHNCDFCI